MHSRIKTLLAVGALLFLWRGLVGATPYYAPVTFAITTNTSYGQSVFVVGSISQLGNWAPTNAIKLVPSNCTSSNCLWSITIGLPEGVTYEYKFIKRDDCAMCLSNNANVVWEPGANRTGSTPAGPVAPFSGKSVFYYSGWTNVWLYYSNNLTGWTNLPMTPVKPGRGGGEQVWRADGVDRLGATNVQFGFFSVINGTNAYDNAGRPGVDYQTPLDACVVQDGQIYNYWPAATISAPWVETFSSTPTNGLQSRTVRVYLPRGFTNNVTKRYPVLYMNDGQNLFLGQGNFGGWNADTNATHLIRFGKMRELIIVGIDNTSDRTCEYNPCNLTSCGASNSLAPRYVDYVINQLKPYIDTQYPTTAGRTLTDADNTGIVGSSRGGLCAAWFGWEHSDVFHKVGGLSPSFWGCDTTKNNLANAPKRPLRIYLDSGSVGDFPTTDPVCNSCYDGELYTLTARDNLINNGYLMNVDLDHWISYGDQHNEFYWNRRLPRCYQFLFPTTDEPNTVLDSVSPLRITGFQYTNNNFSFTWPSFQRRVYSVLGATNLSTSLSNWSTLYTAPAEARPWNYLTAPPTNGYRFFRVQQQTVPYWPN
jgi:predicted alpha/beta superfamily hydrolase